MTNRPTKRDWTVTLLAAIFGIGGGVTIGMHTTYYLLSAVVIAASWAFIEIYWAQRGL